MEAAANIIEIKIGSALEYLDLVQAVTDCITDFMPFDKDTAYWIGMSVRESVTNAIQHGNKLDKNSSVDICFDIKPDRLAIQVTDQGSGFKVEDLPNPLDPANLLKPSGRGIFYIRSFMDEVEFKLLSQGGMQIHMVKRVAVD